MKIIFKEVNSGKTTELIEQSIKNSYTIVCYGKKEADIIYKRAKLLKAFEIGEYSEATKNIPFPITYDEFIGKRWVGKGIKGFLIDDVDRLVEFMASPNLVKSITLTIPSTDNLN